MFYTMALLEDDDDIFCLCLMDDEIEEAVFGNQPGRSIWVRPWIQERHNEETNTVYKLQRQLRDVS